MSDATAVSTESEEREPGSTHTSAHELGDITAQWIAGGLQELEQTVGAEGDAVDYYRFTLSESREVRLGLKLREGEAELSVEDAAGNVLARSVAFGTHEAAVRTFLPGTYYVRVEAVGTVASAYELRYRLRAHDITETRDAADDCRSDTSTTGVVTVGGSVTGEIERSGDHDWFAVDLVEGRLYRIDLKGRSTGDGTLKDPYLRGVHDDNGVLIRGTWDDDGGVGRNSRVVFTAPADATYYLAAGAFLDRKGTYALSVTEVHDDFVAGTGTSGTVEVGGSATGEIDYRGDRDWFAVTLQAGKVYRFDLKGEPTGDGTLPYPYVRGIYDADGDRIDGMSGAYSNVGSNPMYSRMDFVAPADDTYYVSAGARFNGYHWRGGTYTLSVTEVADDYASGIGTTGTLAVGDSTTGAIDHMDDRDWFAVTLQAGKSYRFDLEGFRSDAGTLDTPKIHGIFDSNGNEMDGARVTHGGFRFYSQAVFTPDAGDTYFVSAGKWWVFTGHLHANRHRDCGRLHVRYQHDRKGQSYWPGGRGRSPTRGSHRSGRAQLRHPAPRIVVSLLDGTLRLAPVGPESSVGDPNRQGQLRLPASQLRYLALSR